MKKRIWFVLLAASIGLATSMSLAFSRTSGQAMERSEHIRLDDGTLDAPLTRMPRDNDDVQRLKPSDQRYRYYD